MAKRVILIGGILTASVLVVGFFVYAVIQAMQKPYWDIAVYEDAFFGGRRGVAYDRLTTGPGTGASGVAPLFVHIDDDTILYLPELDEETLESLAEESRFVDDDDGGFAVYRWRGCSIYLRRGSIVSAYFTRPTRFSLSRQGPFLSLPITHDDMVATFGEPRSYSRAYSSAP